jgi:hypothetical protein
MQIIVDNPYTSHPAAAGGPVITLGGGAASRSVTQPTDAWTGWRVDRDGKVYRQSWTSDTNWIDHEDWHDTPAVDAGDDYEVRFTKNSGDVATGATMGVWYALTADRQIQYSETGMAGSFSGNFTIEIRDAATQTLQDSGVYTMYCNVEPF